MLRCFNSAAEYNGWLEMLRASGNYAYGAKTQGACWDCAPEYKDAMVREGRCDHPETKFSLTKQGELVGSWKPVEKHGRKTKAAA